MWFLSKADLESLRDRDSRFHWRQDYVGCFSTERHRLDLDEVRDMGYGIRFSVAAFLSLNEHCTCPRVIPLTLPSELRVISNETREVSVLCE